MMQRAVVGKKGEDFAVKYLESQGFSILHRNWRCGHKEIDIVARKGDRLHFVEVRTRTWPSLNDPAQTIDRRKQLLLLQAARAYIARYRLDMEAQFDAVALLLDLGAADPLTCRVEYIPDAFSSIY